MARGSQSEAKGGAASTSEESHELKDCKVLIKELLGYVLRPSKDKQMHSAYTDCFFMITKQFADSPDPALQKLVAFTYKELLTKYLGGRGSSNKCLNPAFFARIFEHCNASLTKSLIKPVLNPQHLVGSIG